jgi:hypothetical protein
MKILIGIISCHDHYHQHQDVRETWLRGCPVDHKFFVGAGGHPRNPTRMLEWSWHSRCSYHEPIPYDMQFEEPRIYPPLLSDEIILPCPDTYKYLPYKTQGLHRYVVENGYDFTFQCNVDTYVFVDRLLRSDFVKHDYVGWATDGALHEKEYICDEFKPYQSIRRENGVRDTCLPWASGGSGYWLSRRASEIIAKEPITHWAEDLWVGAVLHREDISLHHESGYDSRAEGKLDKIITRHLVSCDKRGGEHPTIRGIHQEARGGQ